MRPDGPRSTLTRTIRAGRAVGRGTERAYRELAAGGGEPRVLRTDLLAADPPDLRRFRPLVRLVQFSDLQIADVQSPGRIEFLESVREVAGGDFFVPVSRPQEALAPHGFEAVVRTINALGPSAESGRDVDLVVSTGDNIDNAQHNELDWYLTLLTGGRVHPSSGAGGYQGPQDADWPNPALWHPDGGADDYRTRWGFPTCPGLLPAAIGPFEAAGLDAPWLSCFGNHEALVGGTGTSTVDYERILLGAAKPVSLAAHRDAVRDAQLFCTNPERFLDGPSRPVVADAARRTISRAEHVRRIVGCPGRHGLDATNVRDGTAYGCYDTDSVRILMLDTTNLDGEAEGMTSGSVGDVQYHWLEDRLRETSRPTVLLSHHTSATITTTGGPPPRGREPDARRRTRADLLDLIFRFPNVVLWLNGHEHVNRVAPRIDPRGRHPGFWEVTTSAVIDWPCQVRQVELFAGPDDTLAITTTMVDFTAPLTAASLDTVTELAALQRELAANDPFRGLSSAAAGTASDRNTVLLRSWRSEDL